jgi:hypothetical protein
MNKKLKKIRQMLIALALIAAVEGFSSCEKYSIPPAVVDANQTWYLSTDIQPIFNGNCISCHGSNKVPDLREGKSWESLTKGGFVNLPGDESRLYKHMTTNSQHIPRSTDEEKLKVLNWINQGALNN